VRVFKPYLRKRVRGAFRRLQEASFYLVPDVLLRHGSAIVLVPASVQGTDGDGGGQAKLLKSDDGHFNQWKFRNLPFDAPLRHDLDGKRGSSRCSTSFFLPPSFFFHTVQNKLEFRVIGKNISIS
jgi:hypothetical protein